MEMIEKMYTQQDYAGLLVYYSENEIHSLGEKIIIAFALLEIGYFSDALACLKNIDENELDLNYAGKFYRYKGLAYFYFNHYAKAAESFEKGLKYDDQESELWKKLLFVGINEISEVGRITFRFVDELQSIEKKMIIMSGVATYKKMKDFFGYDFDKKIDMYIYSQPFDSLGNKLSYVDNGMKIIYLYKKDFVNHEIVHLFANSLYVQMNRNHFIDEGIATFLSAGLEYISYLKKYRNRFIKFDLVEAWENGVDSSEAKLRDSYYYVFGALIGFLIEKYGKEKLFELIRDECYNNAKKVYGIDFASQLEVFLKDIGF